MYSRITQQDPTINYNTDLNGALRHAINDQINHFFQNQDPPFNCRRCGKMAKCEVDHILPFHHIKTEFMKTVKEEEIPTEFYDDINNTCTRIFKDQDKIFKEKWQSFHNKMATYQLLCPSCNRKKSKKILI